MSEVFADTSYFIALVSPTDSANSKARAFVPSEATRLVTTAWVLTEFANSMADHRNRRIFVDLLETLRGDPWTLVIEARPEHFESGVRLYASRSDKDWSLTDCISFTVMHERGIADALTGDRHFEQAGFNALLKLS